MKKSALFLASAALLLTACASADKQAPKNTINQEEVMTKLSLEDKAHFVIGVGMAGFSGDNAVIGEPPRVSYPVPLVPPIPSTHWESPLSYWLTVLPVCVSTLPVRVTLPPTTAPISPLVRCSHQPGTSS